MGRSLDELKIKIFADGAEIESMLNLAKQKHIKGFTTNPSFMKKAGVKNYREFAKELLSKIKTLPISFEVFADDLAGMESQAREISSWGQNVYVKIPITNTKQETTMPLVTKLSNEGLKLNVTALFTAEQPKFNSETQF